jgi:hypothetical protein
VVQIECEEDSIAKPLLAPLQGAVRYFAGSGGLCDDALTTGYSLAPLRGAELDPINCSTNFDSLSH